MTNLPAVGPDQEELLQALVAAGMTQGLSNDPVRGLGFSGPVAGYAGPVRPSDVPIEDQVGQLGRTEALRGTSLGGSGPLGNVGQLMDLASGLKGVPKEVLEALMGRLTGIDPQAQEMARQKELLQFKHGLGGDDRAERLDVMRQRIEAMMQNQQAQRALAESKNRLPLKDARQSLIDAWNSGIRDPQALAQIAQDQGYSYGGGSSETVLGVPTGRDFQPRLGVRQPEVKQGAQPQAKAKPTAAAKASNVLRTKSKSGKPIISTDGGITWNYEQ